MTSDSRSSLVFLGPFHHWAFHATSVFLKTSRTLVRVILPGYPGLAFPLCRAVTQAWVSPIPATVLMTKAPQHFPRLSLLARLLILSLLAKVVRQSAVRRGFVDSIS